MFTAKVEFTATRTAAEAKMELAEAKRRSKLWFKPQPVKDVSHRAHDSFAWAYKGSWVASVTLIKSIQDHHALSAKFQGLHDRIVACQKRVEWARGRARKARTGLPLPSATPALIYTLQRLT